MSEIHSLLPRPPWEAVAPDPEILEAPLQGGNHAGNASLPDEDPSEPSWRRPGGLGISEPRSWKTWQLVSASFAALLIGMAVTNGGNGAEAPPRSSAAPSAAERSSPSTRRTPPSTPAGSTDSTTKAADPGNAGPASLLIDIPAHKGPAQSDHFTAGSGGWQLGYAYNCSGATAQSFEVKVHNADGSDSSDAAIREQGPAGKNVARYTSAGERYVEVNSDCLWRIKVVG